MFNLTFDHIAESVLTRYAQSMQDDNEVWKTTINAQGRTLIWQHHFKDATKMAAFNIEDYQRVSVAWHCSKRDDFVLGTLKAVETHTFYSPEGKRLTSFSISPADCPSQ